jgi:hypothetical protein
MHGMTQPETSVWVATARGPAPLDTASLARAWQRPPYRLTLQCLRQDGSRAGTATIGTRGSFAAFAADAAAKAAILRQQAGDAAGAQPRPAWHRPSLRDTAALAGGALRRAGERWRARLLSERWSIGVIPHDPQTIEGVGKTGPISWMKPPPGRGYADPFPWSAAGRVLCEEIMANGRGRITVLASGDDSRLVRERVLMDGADHFSYPCTFADAGELYLVAETIAARATRIWRLQANGARSLAATVAQGQALADPTLFRAAGLLWLAATDLAIGAHDNLCLFHAGQIAGPWVPHRGNPVKIDIGSARPAGAPFISAGRLIRPAQDCAPGYGAAVVLNEVLELTPDRFAELPLRRIAPDPAGPYPHGLHTLNAGAGGTTLVDGKRLVFSAAALAGKLARRAGFGRA